jgi:hypothetical protein
MATSIDCLGMNHINAVVSDFDASVAHFRELYGAEFLADLPFAGYPSSGKTPGTQGTTRRK